MTGTRSRSGAVNDQRMVGRRSFDQYRTHAHSTGRGTEFVLNPRTSGSISVECSPKGTIEKVLVLRAHTVEQPFVGPGEGETPRCLSEFLYVCSVNFMEHSSEGDFS